MAAMERPERLRRTDQIQATDRMIAPGPGGRYRGEYEVRVIGPDGTSLGKTRFLVADRPTDADC